MIKKFNDFKDELINSKEFIDFFGDWKNNPENSSKVVDNNGKPLFVYHGSPNQFNIFTPSQKLGTHNEKDQIIGIYFTDKRHVAEWYAPYDNPKFIKSCFLSIKKPFKVDSIKMLKEKLNISNLSDARDLIIKKGFDGLIIKKGFYTLGEQILYLCFYPNQIKLADGSNTTFDKNNPDITK
jgi:hypothetical protein